MTADMSVFSAAFFIRFAIHALTLLVFLRVIYYRHSPDRDTLFGYTVLGYGVYFLASLLHSIEVSMGFAFGLFAIFSMLRYRTESLSVREMTYLFSVIVMALIAAVGPISFIELAILSVVMCVLTYVAETTLFAPKYIDKKVLYENIELVKPQCAEALLQDLRERTGLDIVKYSVGNIDYLRDTAEIRIYYLQSAAAKYYDH